MPVPSKEERLPSSQLRLDFDWVDALKAFAILGIFWNHWVEEFSPGPWFTNPSDDWPLLSIRLQNILPPVENWGLKMLYFLGWLGDSGPGVFILLSGFGLTISQLQKTDQPLRVERFYKKRLLRILPLYLVIHLLIVSGAFFIYGQEAIPIDINLLLSLLGLRFTDALFFYINPSWWFIWLILQLYLVFPLLWLLVRRWGVSWLLAFAMAITLLSRGAGLLGFRYSDSLYNWMTGVFFGTRLAEFALGMALAWVMVHGRERVEGYLRVSRVLPISIGVYLAGLCASFLWAGTLVSNILVTAGLSGLFYALWEGIVKRFLPGLQKPLLWIGVSSFGLYLLHQPLLEWTGAYYQGIRRFALTGLVLMLSFPLAWMIQKAVTAAQMRLVSIEVNGLLRWLGLGVALLLLAFCKEAGFVHKGFGAILMITLTMALVLLIIKTTADSFLIWQFFVLAAIFSTGLTLFVFPFFSMFAIALGTLIAGLTVVFNRLGSGRLYAWALSFLAAGALVSALEWRLVRTKPMETGLQWGELPALEINPTRIYGLKPDRETRLRYNHYDYVLRTNSHGLPGPEITPARTDSQTLRILALGDAFTMPEGVEYEYAYPALLENLLRDSLSPGTVQVINAGVTGYGPNEVLAQLAELLPLFKPDWVTYQFFVNEFEEIQVTPQERLRDIGLISDWTPFEKAVRGAQVPAYARNWEARLFEWIKHRDAGYRYNKCLLSYYEKDNERLYNPETLQQVEGILHEMKRLCDEHQAGLTMFFVPAQVEISKPEDIAYYPVYTDLTDTARFDFRQPGRLAAIVAAQAGVRFVNLAPALKKHPAQPVYFRESWHWNREGHRAAAQAVFSELTANDNPGQFIQLKKNKTYGNRSSH